MQEPGDSEKDRSERFTEEELRVVRHASIFEVYLGKGWLRGLVVYGVPAVSALLVAAGIFSSFIEVGETLLMYSQPAWIPGSHAGVRVAVMDRDGEFLPVTDLEMTIRDGRGDRTQVLASGVAHGTRAASLTIVAPGWPAGVYELDVRARTTRRAKHALLPVTLDPGYEGEPAETTRELGAWRTRYGNADFMQPGSSIRVELLPEGGQLASSLPNILYVRTTTALGEPVPARVKLSIAEGYISGELPAEIETDALGLAAFIVYPTFNVLVMDVAAVPLEPAAPAEDPGTALPSLGHVVLPIGPQGIRMRPLEPAPAVGEPVRLRVYTIGDEHVMFMDLYRDGVWLDATGTTVESRSSEIAAPAARQPGLHVIQVYASPVPAYYQKLPGQKQELMSCSISAAHVWARSEGSSDAANLQAVTRALLERGADAGWVRHLTSARLEAGGFNEGLATAFLLSRLDGSVRPPPVAATSRASDKESASSLHVRIRWTVVTAFGVLALIVVAAFGFLTVKTWRAGRAGAPGAGAVPSETPLSSQDPRWMRIQVFQMTMIIVIVVSTLALLAVLVMVLRWHLG